MSKVSPTQRSLKALRDAGYDAAVVEKWNPHARIRQDLFNVFDLVAITPVGILAVQVTSGSHVAERVAKIMATPAAKRWLRAGGMIEVHGWRKAGARGKRKKWECRTVVIEQHDPEDINGLPT